VPGANIDAPMTYCWAETLGDCSDKLSREHIVSEGMFPDQVLRVKGMSWCLEDFKEININNFVKKVLCQHHNSSLTDVDQAGKKAMKVFRDEVHLKNARSAMRPRRWLVKTFQIDGRRLERWCLKTLINVGAEGKYRIGRDSGSVGKPSARLVRIAFGQEHFKTRAGLYGVAKAGTNLNIVDGFRLIPYIDNEGTMLGGIFGIHGYQFMLYVEDSGLAQSVSIPDFNGGPDFLAQTLYPLKGLNFKIGKHISHVFKFVYPVVRRVRAET
jgi:hypothetical protein